MLNHKGLAKDHLGQVLSRPVIRGVQGAKPPLEKFSLPLEKCVGHSLKMLDIVQKFGPSQKTLRPSWCPKLVTGMVLSQPCC